MHSDIINATLVLLALAVFSVILFKRLNLPAILGYLFIGAIAGPHALGWLQSDHTTLLLGEIGVVFLLFSIGLEFSVPKFIRMRKALLSLGGTQVLIGTVSGMIICMFIGMSWQAALIIGGALSLSSTAIVLKQLVEQAELHKDHGQVALSILLFQDIAAIPFLIMIPVFALGDNANILNLLSIALLKGVIALVVLLIIGHYVLGHVFKEVANSRSLELFTLTVLLISLSAAWLTDLMGLSLALGAFIAGMMLSETHYRHQINNEIRPFRDILMGLFFITVGMQLNIIEISHSWFWVGLMLLGIVFGKGILVIALAKLAGYRLDTAIKSGVILAQGGEFSIALLSLALATNLINLQELQPVLASIILSMVLAPLLIRYSDHFISKLFSKKNNNDVNTNNTIIETDHKEHVIICGYGRTGQRIKRILDIENISSIAIDHDSNAITSNDNTPQDVFYGDASDIRMLESIGLKSAVAIVISFSDIEHSKVIIHSLRQNGYELPIIARAYNQNDMEILLAAGANEVVPEDLETSLMLSTQLLLAIGVPSDDVLKELDEIKQIHYKLFKKPFSS